MTRRTARLTLTALVAVFSLLFAQLALARYACPAQGGAAAMQAMVEAGLPCEGMDAAQPALCHRHSADPAQSPGVLKLPAPSVPALLQVVTHPLLRAIEPAFCAVPVAATVEARPPPDPLFLATLRLRV